MADFVEILGIELNNVALEEAATRIEQLSESQPFSFTCTANIDHFVKLQHDSEFREIYERADLVVADGVPVTWAARFLGTPLKDRVNGTDLFELLVARASERRASVFLLGGDDGVAEIAAARLKQKYPALHVAGVHCPPFGFESSAEYNQKIKDMIACVRPTYLFVGLGAPKQEKWIAAHAAATGARHAIGIGVSFSFVAKRIRRAPRWMQRTGFEWLWRLGSEPRRLWRRYLVEDPRFFWLVLNQKLGRWRSPIASRESA